MSLVRVAQEFPGTVHDAETVWYDTTRWPSWIDGLAHLTSVDGDWPRAGSTVKWSSGPAGRGQVTEHVVEHEPLGGQTLEVQDESIVGRQKVIFTPADRNVEVDLSLEYRLRKRSIFAALVDVLFIRRAMATSLRITLTHFGMELAATRRPEADD